VGLRYQIRALGVDDIYPDIKAGTVPGPLGDAQLYHEPIVFDDAPLGQGV
jgi:hypothetical protein